MGTSPCSTLREHGSGRNPARCSAPPGCQEPQVCGGGLLPVRFNPNGSGADLDIGDSYETVAPIPRREFNFDAHGAVPPGWTIVKKEAPGCFQFIGRDACIIAQGNETAQNILLALPTWAVDIKSGTLLANLTSSGLSQPLRNLCQLRSCSKLNTMNTAVCNFRCPLGVPLHEAVHEYGRLTEDNARAICGQLLDLVRNCHRSNVYFRGLLLPSTVFLQKGGNNLEVVVPIGSVLSWAGFKATVQDIESHRIAPEISSALYKDVRRFDLSRYSPASADVFAVAALVLEGLAGVPPNKLKDPKVAERVSDDAYDFLLRALHGDPAWRLSLEDALVHRWLRPPPQQQQVEKRRQCFA
eukprot:TRINITY_DN17756_c0_g1_i1.p1 TRINITY_DN17756_c0_g1~~TRINITY_DN17756_c0_g1_i1.p1  ORF type:complete len:389 (+),score=81.33 TRINITY_DN17756_c0_g1_i1:104-1168(+)